ncbi:unnamed protein product, partial [marine sediment metagenome]
MSFSEKLSLGSLILVTLKKEMPVIFDQVKKNVRKVYGRHRAGLNLGL